MGDGDGSVVGDGVGLVDGDGVGSVTGDGIGSKVGEGEGSVTGDAQKYYRILFSKKAPSPHQIVGTQMSIIGWRADERPRPVATTTREYEAERKNNCLIRLLCPGYLG